MFENCGYFGYFFKYVARYCLLTYLNIWYFYHFTNLFFGDFGYFGYLQMLQFELRQYIHKNVEKYFSEEAI